MSTTLRYLWAAPATAIGLVLAMFALRGGRLRLVEGVVEADGPLLKWALATLIPLPGGAAALTLGHVVLATDMAALGRTRAHERVHVRQYERWGPLFVPAYLAASVWALVQGRHAYSGNRFEREAVRRAEADDQPGRSGRRALGRPMERAGVANRPSGTRAPRAGTGPAPCRSPRAAGQA